MSSSDGNDAGSPSGGGSGGTASGGTASGGGAASGGAANGGATGGVTSGGTASGGSPTGGVVGCGGFYSMTVNALSGDGAIEYAGADAVFRDVDFLRELEIMGVIDGEGGIYGYTRLVVRPYDGAGTYNCSNGAATITTLQQCCANEYDTRNMPLDECTIVVAGIAGQGQEIVGTFEGIPHDENGGRMVLRDGRFCALIRD
jgi:hypothetical protein